MPIAGSLDYLIARTAFAISPIEVGGVQSIRMPRFGKSWKVTTGLFIAYMLAVWKY
jgi:hypothetical protein